MAKLSSYPEVTTLVGTERIPVVTPPFGVDGGNKWITAANFHAASFSLEGTVVTTATGDGTTNDLAQIRTDLAAAAGGRLYLPPGSYKCSVAVALQAFFTAPAETIIEGAGEAATELVLYATDSGYHTGIAISVNDFTLKNLTIRRASDYDSVLFDIGTSVTGFRTEGCLFDGAEPTLGTGYTHGIKYPNSGTVTTVTSDDCTWTKFEYPFLTDNASTATITNIRYRGCRMLTNSADGVGFNHPNGTCSDVGVEGCRIIGAGIGIDFAHVRDGYASNNYIEAGSDAIHIEDYSTDITVAGNTIYESGLTSGSSPVNIIDSSRVSIESNKIVNTTATFAALDLVVQVLGDVTGTTIGGRAKLGATNEVSVINNQISAGPNTAIWIANCANYNISGNTLKGGLAISSSFVESGTNTRTGILVVGSNGDGAGVVNDNTIVGFRYATNMPTGSAVSWTPGSSVVGNTIRECRYGIIGRMTRSVNITGNNVQRCINPMAVGASGNGSAGVGCDPYVIVGNLMNGNQRAASIGGKIVVVATGAATIGAGRTLTIDPLLLDLVSNRVFTFSGGGTLTTTTIGVADDVSLIGTVATANIASGEVGTFTGLVDRPYEAPWNVDNHAIAGNYDSLAP